jgi:nitrite reductase/ring-hydroxylating ferredoxin subunit
MTGYDHGWYQVAFERDLDPSAPVTPLSFGERSLMAIRTPGMRDVRVFDAVCPHRGANLAYGGRLAGEAMVCPFHGHRIGLGHASNEGFRVTERACLSAGGGLFVRLSEQALPDFPRGLEELSRGHSFVPAFEMTAETTIEVVIENGFDGAHFPSVHGLLRSPGLVARPGSFGELAVEGTFEIPSGYEGGRPAPAAQARYVGHAFSPGLFIAELAGDDPFRYGVMTTATPVSDGRTCTVRLTLILPSDERGRPDEGFARELIEYSRDGLEKDCAIWRRLAPRHVSRLTPQDEPVVAFAAFCRSFRSPSEG